MYCFYGPATTLMLLILAMGLMVVAVHGKRPDTTIIKGPDCFGKSPSTEYNDNVRHLVDSFVKDTKGAHKNIDGDRQFNHSYPNRNPGSPYGWATCYMDLGKADCTYCLSSAEGRLSFGCLHPVSGSVTLQDCSIWFNITT